MAALRQDQLQEVLDFLNSIEGAGYGGMATFEIARMNILQALERIPEVIPLNNQESTDV